MNKIVAIQADALSSINVKTDTTLLIALEAQKRLYQIYWYQTKDLSLINGKVYAKAKKVKFFENTKNFYKVSKIIKLNLAKAKFILIRQNPPFNMDYITSTLYLENLNKKVKVLNNPFSIRNISEKFYSVNFLNFMPPTIFTKDLEIIKDFYKKNKKIVIKPIHGYAGKDILFIDKNFNNKKINNYINKIGHVMIQKFLPLIKNGDKRVFILDGKVKGAIRRKPLKGSILSNISQGGFAIKTKLNKNEMKISNAIAAKLKKNNIFFAGIDLVSNYLIGDINVTSPTGLPQYKNLTGINLAKSFWDEAEKLK
jgi:glutathione synthase|tara:strand:+ start:596 stop:1528 length:933 start_codon:yes stop_codon:yes gene_type:complete